MSQKCTILTMIFNAKQGVIEPTMKSAKTSRVRD